MRCLSVCLLVVVAGCLDRSPLPAVEGPDEAPPDYSGTSVGGGGGGGSAPPDGWAPLEPPSDELDLMNAPLMPSLDFCEYQQTAPVVPTGDADGDWLLDRSPYAFCTHGRLRLSMDRTEQPWGQVREFNLFAELYEVYASQDGFTQGIEHDPLEGVGDCGLVEITSGLGIENTEGLYFMDAGTVTVSTDAFAHEVHPHTVADYHVYKRSVGWQQAADLPEGTLASWSFSGGDFWALELDDVMPLPRALEVTAPDLSVDGLLPRNSLQVTWTGANGLGTVEIRVRATEAGISSPSSFELTCLAADNGAFTIPASMLRQLPAGWNARFSVTREDVQWFGTTHGRVLQAVSASSHVGPWLVLLP